jgi:hypothetical protein
VKILKANFGADIKIALDLFHAIGRTFRTLKKNDFPDADKKVFKREVRLLFRQRGDQEKQRKMPTDSTDNILERVNQLIKRWDGTVSPTTIEALTTLRDIHIKKGCLSNIPISAGTQHNESIHQSLNSYFKNRKNMSLEVFRGMLLAFFVMHNRNKSGIMLPLSSNMDILVTNVTVLPNKVLGYGFPYRPAKDVIPPNCNEKEVLSGFALESIVKNVEFLLKVSENLETSSISFRSNEILTGSRFRTLSDNLVCDEGHDLSKLLDGLSVKKKTTASILVDAVASQLVAISSPSVLCDIFGFSDFIKVKEVVTASGRKKNIDQIVQKVANVTKTVFVILSPKSIYSVQTVYPRVIRNDKPLILVFENGLFHETGPILNDVLPGNPDISCTCGRSVKQKGVPCNGKGTKCPCWKNGQGCGASCKCQNCKNENGTKNSYQPKEKRCKCGSFAKSTDKKPVCNSDTCKCFKYKRSCIDNPR